MSTDGAEPLPESDIDAKWLANAIRTVQSPATVMQWYGIISLLLAIAYLIIYLVSPDTICQPIYDAQLRKNREQQKEQPGQVPNLPPYHEWVRPYVVSGVIFSVISLPASFFIAFGAVKMRHLNGFGWSVAASILSILPCTNSCCCAGLPIGLWALVILFGQDVRLAFARVGRAGGLEAFGDVEVPREEPPPRPIRLE